MKEVNILDARNNLSRLVAAASQGEEVVIANRGRPVVRLVPVDDPALRHSAGLASAWLSAHPVPTHATRTAAELDEDIAGEREGWE